LPHMLDSRFQRVHELGNRVNISLELEEGKLQHSHKRQQSAFVYVISAKFLA